MLRRLLKRSLFVKIVRGIIRYAFPVIGVICIIFPKHIVRVLPYLLGGAMALVGILRIVRYMQNRAFLLPAPNELAFGIILLIVGAGFMIQGVNALSFVGTVWAIIGIYMASRSLRRTIQRIYRKAHFAAPLLEFLLRGGLSMTLLFDPFEGIAIHVVILGLELIAISVRLNKMFSPAWEFWL